MKEWAIPALGTFLLWGIWGFLPKITVQYISPRSAIIYEVLGGIFVTLIIVLTALYPIVSILLAFIFLHEAISLKQWLNSMVSTA